MGLYFFLFNHGNSEQDHHFSQDFFQGVFFLMLEVFLKERQLDRFLLQEYQCPICFAPFDEARRVPLEEFQGGFHIAGIKQAANGFCNFEG